MDKQEKQLLLVDLCARLPYNVIVSKSVYGHTPGLYYLDLYKIAELQNGDPVIIKPYLRPMSSMTKAEKEEERKLWDIVTITRNDLHYIYTDFLLSRHIDFRGLIPKGLALEAPEGMYK